MTVSQIAALVRKLIAFLSQFADCFVRSEGRKLLRIYVQGQLSQVHRKTAEGIALEFGTAPRTLQRFLENIKWNEEKFHDRCQQIVAKGHAHPDAIGVVDESGVAKSGRDTVGVARQWNGSRGKVDNCVVGVHLSYAAPGFQCLAGSGLYLPEDWANDPARRKKLHSRRGRVSHETTTWLTTHRSRFGQWNSCGGLDLRRVLRPRQQVPGWLGTTAADIRRRGSRKLSWLGAEAANSAYWSEKEQETRPCQAVSAFGPSPSFL